MPQPHVQLRNDRVSRAQNRGAAPCDPSAAISSHPRHPTVPDDPTLLCTGPPVLSMSGVATIREQSPGRIRRDDKATPGRLAAGGSKFPFNATRLASVKLRSHDHDAVSRSARYLLSSRTLRRLTESISKDHAARTVAHGARELSVSARQVIAPCI